MTMSAAAPQQVSAPFVLSSVLASEDRFVLTLKLSCVLLLLHGATAPAMGVPIRILCGAMLLFPDVIRSKVAWWTLFVSLVLGNGVDWFVIDNHKYLISYWTLACVLALHNPRPQEYLSRTATLLVGIVFGFAVIWKVIGGQYLNGSFLYWTFLTDPRVQRVGSFVGGLSPEDVRQGSQALRMLGALAGAGTTVPMLHSQALSTVTYLISYLVLLGEGGLSAAHLFSNRQLYLTRHVLLIGFIPVTYFLLPVAGFAFVLTLLGFAQCDADDLRMPLAYLSLLVAIQFIVLPWQSLLPS